jgi:hypothetical protein
MANAALYSLAQMIQVPELSATATNVPAQKIHGGGHNSTGNLPFLVVFRS